MVEVVDAVQRCFENNVQQCLDACPLSLRVRSRRRGPVSQVNAVRLTGGPRRVPMMILMMVMMMMLKMMMLMMMMLMMMMTMKTSLV